jgi:hypothetical protein
MFFFDATKVDNIIQIYNVIVVNIQEDVLVYSTQIHEIFVILYFNSRIINQN